MKNEKNQNDILFDFDEEQYDDADEDEPEDWEQAFYINCEEWE